MIKQVTKLQQSQILKYCQSKINTQEKILNLKKQQINQQHVNKILKSQDYDYENISLQQEQKSHKNFNIFGKDFSQKIDLKSALKLILQTTNQHISSIQQLNSPQISQISSNFQLIQNQLQSSHSFSPLKSQQSNLVFEPNPQKQRIEQNQFETLQFNEPFTQSQQNQMSQKNQSETFQKLQTIIDKLILINTISFSSKIAPLLHIKQQHKICKSKPNLQEQKKYSQNQFDQQKNVYISKKQEQSQNNKYEKKEQNSKIMQSSSKFEKLDFQFEKPTEIQVERIQEEQLSFQDLNQQNDSQMKENFEDNKNNDKLNEAICEINQYQQPQTKQVLKQSQKILIINENKIKASQQQCKDMDGIIDQNIKYMIHFSLFCMQIIGDIGSPQTFSLSRCYNVYRYIIINLITHFRNLTINKIKQQIKQILKSQAIHTKFDQKLSANKRFQKLNSKFEHSRQVTFQRILNYLQRMQQCNQMNFASMKTSNITLLYKLKKEKPQLIQLLTKLNNNPKIQYTFQTLKNIYNSIICLAQSEFLNSNYLNKHFICLCRSHNYTQISQNSFLSEVNRHSIKNKKTKAVFDDLIIIIMQLTKISSMLFSLPYYTFANQMENEERKLKNKKFPTITEFINELNKKQQIINLIFQSQKTQQREKQYFQFLFKHIEILFIMKGNRINRKYWQDKLKLDKLGFYEDVENYLALHQKIIDFYLEKQPKSTKSKLLTKGCLSKIKYNHLKLQPLHCKKNSIFQFQEEKIIQQLIKNTLTSDQLSQSPIFNKDSITKIKTIINPIWKKQ